MLITLCDQRLHVATLVLLKVITLELIQQAGPHPALYTYYQVRVYIPWSSYCTNQDLNIGINHDSVEILHCVVQCDPS